MAVSDASRKRSDVSTGSGGPRVAAAKADHALQPLVGRWITVGSTIAAHDPSLPICASDVYEWVPGNHFVVHHVFGTRGTTGVGGVEIIGYDRESKTHRTWFFDNEGNVEEQTLIVRGRAWTWFGEKTRCKATLSPDGTTMVAHHARSDDGRTWVPTMGVTLRKVG